MRKIKVMHPSISKIRLIILIILGSTVYLSAQEINTITILSNEVNETSGLLFHNGRLITHNDSGGEAYLYEIDSIGGEILRTVFIENAINVDWEDICFDANYIYIGDIGNNAGMRNDLKIYRVELSEYLIEETVIAEIINFSYSDQSDFSNQLYSNNFDAEGLISFNNHLYIFTKNWLDGKSNVYKLSKTPGNYVINKTDSLISNGLITGADYNLLSNKLILTGYSIFNPFIVEINDFQEDLFSSGYSNKIEFSVNESIQIESVSSINQKEYYMTSEASNSGSSCLYRLKINDLAIENIEEEKNEIIKTIDFLGREIDYKKFIPFIDIYQNGTSQKRIIIE